MLNKKYSSGINDNCKGLVVLGKQVDLAEEVREYHWMIHSDPHWPIL